MSVFQVQDVVFAVCASGGERVFEHGGVCGCVVEHECALEFEFEHAFVT